MIDHLTPTNSALTDLTRKARYGHNGAVIWLTGLSASGKSSLAHALERTLFTLGYACYVLDGDNLRTGLNADLGFCHADRSENIRRVGTVAALFADAGLICIAAVISPYREDRAKARQAHAHGFHEIHVAADLQTCEARDPKGLYRKARTGELSEFTGISAPYEPPHHPQLYLDTAGETLEASLEKLLNYVLENVPRADEAQS
ncbi:adenylylsulfate kinase [Pseudomonas sp. ok272]|uniref:adenylyl-sulfate kinase n=1 Tax=unclassified Pseudomonas TaxID=196821 RepID=UPI0008ABE207|nr:MULTISPECIES: adenylyl-sulfate kinase [unclassified Pseudomonas]SEM62633.1 adenylylsulfate kinase [Pseudomonas sp. ok272]SFM47537.1 adenylylsulfate kinase [Pseudomonas sp. ok602]